MPRLEILLLVFLLTTAIGIAFQWQGIGLFVVGVLIGFLLGDD